MAILKIIREVVQLLYTSADLGMLYPESALVDRWDTQLTVRRGASSSFVVGKGGSMADVRDNSPTEDVVEKFTTLSPWWAHGKISFGGQVIL